MTAETLKLIKSHAKHIAHMRAQKEIGKFGLVFGAGASTDLGFPVWKDLVQKIAEDPKVSAQSLLQEAKSSANKSQLLFQKYRDSVVSELSSQSLSWDEINAHIQSGWRTIVRKVLYENVPERIDDLKAKDSYLKDFVDIIKQTPLTVNYNFDDTLQRLISEARTESERETTRGYKILWTADMQPYAQNGVIYHPNGYLPRGEAERPSDGLVFLETSFGDQLIDSIQGHYASLANHYAQTTCLFIGISLEDSTLKHLLRNNSRLYPGHVHYFVRFLQDGDTIDPETERAIRKSDFEVYNVISLFLKRGDIAALGQLLSQPDLTYGYNVNDACEHKVFRFYFTGSVSVGKSTAISHFRCLRTHDEWLDPKVPGMEKDPAIVTDPDAIAKIDEFIVRQWKLKNFNLWNTGDGIHVIDRAPLDAFAFTPEDKWKAKAEYTRMTISPEEAALELCSGTLILLLGDPRIMAARATSLSKVVKKEQLDFRQKLLKLIYNESIEGVRVLDTRDMTANEVAKEICRIIHMEDYIEFDFQTRLKQIESGEVNPNSLIA